MLYFIHREQNFEYYFTVGVSSVDPGRVYDPKLVPHFGSAVGLAIDTHNSRLFAGFEPGDIFQFSVETVLPVFHLSNGTEFKTMLTGLGEMATDWINRKLVWIQQSDSGQEYEVCLESEGIMITNCFHILCVYRLFLWTMTKTYPFALSAHP